MNRIKFFLAVLPLFTVLVSLRGQPVNVQQLQNMQQAQQFRQPLSGLTAGTNAPQLYPDEDMDTGPQQILKYIPQPKYFDMLLDSQVFYSDNANFAAAQNKIGSAVFVNTAQATFMPPEFDLGPGKFAANAGLISQWYNYGNNRMTSLDFNAQTAFASGRYAVDNWQFGAGINYTRLVDQGTYSAQTYAEWLPALTAQRLFFISENLVFAVGNQIDYHFSSTPAAAGASTELNNRFDDITSLTLSWRITQALTFQPYYSFQYSNYRYNTLQTSDRNDYLNSFGVTMTYNFNENFSLRAFFNGNIKNTDDPVQPDYHEYNEGVGAALTFKF